MKKIYWCLQQLKNIGGTEMVTLQIISLLKDYYEIHLISFAPINKEEINYKIPEGVIIEDINFPPEISQFDINFNKKIKEKHFLKAFKLLFKTLNYYVFKRNKYRKIISKMMNKDDILVMASADIMVFAPKDRYLVQHFHFNSMLYYSLIQKVFRLLSRKPDFYIFLTEATRDNINKNHNFRNEVIYNPCRFSKKENFEYNNNTLISVCRFEDQKDPMMLLKIAKELSDRNFSYTFNIFGSGSMKDKMLKYKEKYHLNNVNIISGVTDLVPYYSKSDLYIITSKFEGYPLTVIESTTLSIPVIWMEMSDPTSTIMINNENGFIIPKRDPKLFADKIIETLSNKEELQKLKERTIKTSDRFNIDLIKAKWISTFDNLFKEIEDKK